MGSSLPLVFLSMICGVGGQLTLKAGMTQIGQIGDGSLAHPFALALRVATTPLVIAGLGMYALGALSWLTVLSRLPLSFAYSLLAVGYVITPFLAWLIFRESISPLRWLGIVVISLGVILVSRG
jgi:drug/metabolite transporter (DMT)-like permease